MRARTSRSGASHGLELGPRRVRREPDDSRASTSPARGSASAGGSARSSCGSPGRAPLLQARGADRRARLSEGVPARRPPRRVPRDRRGGRAAGGRRGRDRPPAGPRRHAALVIQALARPRGGELEPAADMLPKLGSGTRSCGVSLAGGRHLADRGALPMTVEHRTRSSSCWAGVACSSARRSRSTGPAGSDGHRTDEHRRADAALLRLARRHPALRDDARGRHVDAGARRVQRYARFEDDDTIRGAWEWSTRWQHDLELDYRRSVAP